ncbi:Helix-turn-helix domain protein [Oceanobacillus oncorhynchi]|uniref:Helix-turn-helix domain protein n=1 Tax=Oceanobacillus oncorhynchi TaxID=545501 RepID=A0A0A1MQT4_9BACI|nr:helix-turn-helix domain-containing protein [Oceanobacillus oncorhynchi]CEI81381.1 Helix-turn-helix domain protein [Oceanobacillus oncorhynchi]
MKVKKAFRFRIYPNKKQIIFIHKTIDMLPIQWTEK